MKKRILILLHTIDVNPSANGICVQSVIKSLLQSNTIEIECVACSELNTEDETITNGYAIHRVKRTFISKLLRFSNKNSLLYKVALVMYHIEKILLYPWWPVEYPFLTERIYKKSVHLQKNKPFDAVISVYKNIENVYAAQKLKKKFPNITHIVYFLDPLSCGYQSKAYSNRYINDRALQLEKSLIAKADKAIYMRSNWDRIQEKYHEDELINKIAISDLPLFVPQCDKTQPLHNDASHPLKITYTGSIQKGIRTPLPFLGILALTNLAVELHFAGQNDYIDEISAIKESFGFDFINHGLLSAEQASELAYASDVLLNLGNEFSSNMMPSKIFQYMSTGKPIISTFSQKEDPTLLYLQKYPQALLLDTNKSEDENSMILKDFLCGCLSNTQECDLSTVFLENTPEFTADIIAKTMVEKSV